MAEASAKFEHEAEAAAVEAAASTDKALSTLWQEIERLRQQYGETVEEMDHTFTAKQAITEIETPEYRTAATAHEAAAQRQQETSDAIVAAENRMATVPARTVAGTLLKLRVVGIEVADEFKEPDGVLNEASLGSVERLTLSALADLERLAGEAAPMGLTNVQSDGARMAALLSAWRKAGNALCNATEAKELTKDPEQEPLLKEKEDAADARECEAWKAFCEAPCRTFADVRQKMRPFQEVFKGSTGGRVDELFAAVDSDLERLTRMAMASNDQRARVIEATLEKSEEILQRYMTWLGIEQLNVAHRIGAYSVQEIDGHRRGGVCTMVYRDIRPDIADMDMSDLVARATEILETVGLSPTDPDQRRAGP